MKRLYVEAEALHRGREVVKYTLYLNRGSVCQVRPQEHRRQRGGDRAEADGELMIRALYLSLCNVSMSKVRHLKRRERSHMFPMYLSYF